MIFSTIFSTPIPIGKSIKTIIDHPKPLIFLSPILLMELLAKRTLLSIPFNILFNEPRFYSLEVPFLLQLLGTIITFVCFTLFTIKLDQDVRTHTFSFIPSFNEIQKSFWALISIVVTPIFLIGSLLLTFAIALYIDAFFIIPGILPYLIGYSIPLILIILLTIFSHPVTIITLLVLSPQKLTFATYWKFITLHYGKIFSSSIIFVVTINFFTEPYTGPSDFFVLEAINFVQKYIPMYLVKTFELISYPIMLTMWIHMFRSSEMQAD